ncbi:MAG: hypothetical protein ACKVOU_10785 [Cytophagales bacterium]
MKTIKLKHIALYAAISATWMSCSTNEEVQISQAEFKIGEEISTTTLAGSVKGTMASGKTYYFSSDLTVNEGDTLFMQPGSTLIAIGDGATPATSPMIIVNGAFFSLGTKEKPNLISVEEKNRGYQNAFKGYWGGIAYGPNSADAVIKWTRLEYAGGPAGPNTNPALYDDGDPRYTITYSNINGNFVLEDSWIRFSKDDGMRVEGGGKVNIMRNTFEYNGESGGEAINIKSGTVGNIAYNLMVGACTNGLKHSNSGGTTIQTNIKYYNNTMINGGARKIQAGRGGSINVEQNAKGEYYNNLIVNCRFGLRIVRDADVANVKYDNNFYYGNANLIVGQFNATSGVGTKAPNDVQGAAKENDPKFKNFNVEATPDFNVSPFNSFPTAVSSQYEAMNMVGTSDFRLQSDSPCIGKGKTDFAPFDNVNISIQALKPTVTPPGKDAGAFQTDGSGNQHFIQ